MKSLSVIGRRVARVEGKDKVTGRTKYSADVHLPGTLWGAVLRSHVSHARVVGVDTTRARGVPGVHAVLTGQDLGESYGRSSGHRSWLMTGYVLLVIL
jgi:4-hydroxybenzoyl-CoA reductase subunit alpha